MTRFDLILTCTLTLISFWPMLIEPYFDLYTKCDLILTYKCLTWFWPALSWPHFDLLSLTSFWSAIVWPHFDLWYLTSFTCNGVTWFWLAIVWPHFDLQWCDPILTCNSFTSFWPVMFDLIWPDFDLQLFDLILTHNVWPYFDLQWCDLMLTYLVSWWPWPMQFKALVRPWHKWLHVWCPLGPVSQDWKTCKKSDDVNGVGGPAIGQVGFIFIFLTNLNMYISTWYTSKWACNPQNM